MRRDLTPDPPEDLHIVTNRSPVMLPPTGFAKPLPSQHIFSQPESVFVETAPPPGRTLANAGTALKTEVRQDVTTSGPTTSKHQPSYRLGHTT